MLHGVHFLMENIACQRVATVGLWGWFLYLEGVVKKYVYAKKMSDYVHEIFRGKGSLFQGTVSITSTTLVSFF